MWQDGIQCELDQLSSYHTFWDLGVNTIPGPEYHKIKVCFVFDVKADGKWKGRLVTWGDMTTEPEESIYSSMATLRCLCIVIFIAEFNCLQLMQGDISNAYLESYMQEKVYFVAGPEFGPLSSHMLIIEKALYRLHSSHLRFHKCLSSVLHKYGFQHSRVDPNLQMHDGDTV